MNRWKVEIVWILSEDKGIKTRNEQLWQTVLLSLPTLILSSALSAEPQFSLLGTGVMFADENAHPDSFSASEACDGVLASEI